MGDGLHGLYGEEAHVGGDEDVGEGGEPCQVVILDDFIGAVFVEEAFLFLVYVQADAAEFFGQEAVDQGLGVNEAAAGGVDQVAPSFIMDMVFSLMMWWVSGVSGQWRDRKSALERSSSRLTYCTSRLELG